MISSRAPIGYIGIAKNECWHSQGIKGFINNEKIILNKYFFYWLINNKQTFINQGSGSTFAEISSKIIKNINIDIPKIFEQQKIIDIIDP